MEPCKGCGCKTRLETNYGTKVCRGCGVENFSYIYDPQAAFMPYCSPLVGHASYTRVKRFRKYLQRAAMEQSANSIPQATWEYLFKGVPFRVPAAIIRHLKIAPKNIRKKCYDCLPFIIKELCPHICVPAIGQSDKYAATSAFRKLEHAYSQGEAFVSYLYALEYILELIGRSDVLPYINKIQCRKRRAAYRWRLDKIFRHK